MFLKVIVIPISQTALQVTNEISLRMMRLMAVKVIILYCGGDFVLQLKRLDVEDGLFVRLEQSEYLCAFLTGLAVIYTQVSNDLFQRRTITRLDIILIYEL